MKKWGRVAVVITSLIAIPVTAQAVAPRVIRYVDMQSTTYQGKPAMRSDEIFIVGIPTAMVCDPGAGSTKDDPKDPEDPKDPKVVPSPTPTLPMKPTIVPFIVPTTVPQTGQPGNDKLVGGAGECPNGSCQHYGWPDNGDRGASNGVKKQH